MTLTQNVGLPYRRLPDDTAPVVELPGGGREVGYAGAIRVRLQMVSSAFHLDDAVRPEWEALGTLPRHLVFAMHENIGDDTRVYHVQRIAGVEQTRGDGGIEEVGGFTVLEV